VLQLNLKPTAHLREFALASQNQKEELLIGQKGSEEGWLDLH
jgi:hypothetical protein